MFRPGYISDVPAIWLCRVLQKSLPFRQNRTQQDKEHGRGVSRTFLTITLACHWNPCPTKKAGGPRLTVSSGTGEDD